MSFGSYNHKLYTFTSNKIAMRNPSKNDKEFLDPDRIATYPHESNFEFQ